MPEYLVRWEIEIDAETPREAAAEALKIMRDAESTATVFKVAAAYDDVDAENWTTVDLLNRYADGG